MMEKGQLFSLDAFLALLAVTLAIGLLVSHTEALYTTSSIELKTIASDWSQIAVKKTLVVNPLQSNNLDSNKLQSVLRPELNTVFGSDYNYEVDLYQGTTTLVGSISSVKKCLTANEVSIIKRPAMVDGLSGYLLMKVCKNEA